MATRPRPRLPLKSQRSLLGFVPGLVSSIALLGCSDVGNPGTNGDQPALARSDSAGVEIVVSSRALWTEETRWQVHPEPDFVIRSPIENLDPPFILFDVGDIITLSDGRIVVENQGTHELLVFDASGSHLTTWGGSGEGPGEFRRMERMFLCSGDQILVQEYHRATVLDAEGRVISTVPRRRLEEISSRLVFHGVSSDCSSALWGWYPTPRNVESSRETLWNTYGLSWVPYEEQPAAHLGTFTRIELLLEGQWELPFSLTPDWTTDGDLVFYGLGDVPAVKVIDRNGAVVRSIRWPASPDPITDADWAAYNRGFDALVSYLPALEASRIEPAMLAFDSMPVFGHGYFGRGEPVPGLRLDGDGNLWVRQYEPVSLRHRVPSLRGPITAQRWWVFDPEGRWLGELATPENLKIRAIQNGVILGVSRDEFDVEEIRAYRIRGGDD